MRPEAFAEPRPQEAVQRHTMEQLADVAPMVPSLAVPESQMVDQLVAVIKLVDSLVPEQIVTVPKISWPSRFPRTFLREPQKAEQLWWKCLSLSLPSVTGSVGRRDLQAHGSYVAWWLRMAPDPSSPGRFFFFLAKDLVDAPSIMQLLFQHFIDSVVEIRGSGCHDSYAQCKLCSSGECGVNCSDKFQQFLIGCGGSCDPAAKAFLGGQCFVRQWILILCQLEGDFERISGFLRVRSIRLLRSILVLLFSLHGHARRRPRQWHALYWFCWY